jgi:hypothetical protein
VEAIDTRVSAQPKRATYPMAVLRQKRTFGPSQLLTQNGHRIQFVLIESLLLSVLCFEHFSEFIEERKLR